MVSNNEMNMQDQPHTISVIAPKLNELDAQGFYLFDYVDGGHPDNWTADLVGDGFYKAQYQNATVNKETGEWSNGKWVKPTPHQRQSTTHPLRKQKSCKCSLTYFQK
ncbi:hypothetical protein C7434_1524 [Pantoea sp. PNA 14-12]|uniref:hypothetical protein n=1 Tax=Pantoea TaxID=53335 RepID=UPI001060492E|nr:MULTISPECIES: hypothetical protein [Pantoea]NRH22903.1 hypothetical protein [Pantoea stewartii]TDS72700.1 hypothetical protein C7434_1524 [Pantoea sp. PNA 14-12]